MRLDINKNRILNRPNAIEYMELIFEDFIEMAGDRLYGEDKSIVGGIATLEGKPVTVLAQVMGRNLEESESVRYSMMNPEGYRKSLRLVKQAEKFGRPVICLVDTVGAYPGENAEKEGQAIAIANHIMELLSIRVPVFSVIIGCGGSGGALALCTANRIAMLENAYFGVISPKGGANILWKDSKRSDEASTLLKMKSSDLLECHAIDEVIREADMEITANNIKEFFIQQMRVFQKFTKEQLVDMRHQKFRQFGKEYLYYFSY